MESLIRGFFKCFLILLIAALIVVFLKLLFMYFTPFILAFLLAGFINPVVNYFDSRLYFSRGLIVVLVLLLAFLLLLFAFVIGVSRIYFELNQILSYLPETYDQFSSQLERFLEYNHRLQQFVENLSLPASISKIIEVNIPAIYEGIQEAFVFLVNEIFHLLGRLPLIITVIFLSIISAFFLCRDKQQITAFVLNLFPGHYRGKLLAFRDEIFFSAAGFIGSRLLLVCLSGFITSFGFWLGNSSFFITLGWMTAMLDLIPIIGPALIFYPLVLYNLLSGNLYYGIYLLLLYIFLSAVRSAIEGKVIGHGLGVHPLPVMMALYAGYRVLGLSGLVIGPAFIILIKALYNAELINIGV